MSSTAAATTSSPIARSPIARSPIAPPPPLIEHQGWQVSERRSTAELTLSDLTPLAKVVVRAPYDSDVGDALGARLGRAVVDAMGRLVIGSGPGEWLVLAGIGDGAAVHAQLSDVTADLGEFVSVIDLTHGRALVRLTGARGADLLAKVCGIDLADTVTPDGTAFRTAVAAVVTDVVRNDTEHTGGTTPSYLLHCERSSGQYLFDALLEAGAEFGIEVDGFRAPGS